MGYAHIVFDIDGTLLDTEDTMLRSLSRAVEELQGRKMEVEELRFAFGITSEDAVKQLGITNLQTAVKLWDTYIPVSYTHLDVYKRQAFCGSGRGLAPDKRAKKTAVPHTGKRHRSFCHVLTSFIFAVDDPETFERKCFVIDNIVAAMWDNKRSEPAGGHHRRLCLQRFLHPLKHPVHHGCAAEYGSAFHTVHSVFPDDVFRGIQADARQLRSTAGERIHGYAYAGSNGTAEVDAVLVNDGKGGGGTHIYDDQRQGVLFYCGYRIHYEITAQLRRVINFDIQPCLDSGANDHDAFMGELFHRFAHETG